MKLTPGLLKEFEADVARVANCDCCLTTHPRKLATRVLVIKREKCIVAQQLCKDCSDDFTPNWLDKTDFVFIPK